MPTPKQSLSPRIVFEDTHLLVLSKPAGFLSQGEHTGDQNLVDWLRQYLGRPYVGLIHRLDRNTSGLMVVAKRTKSAQRLTQSLRDGTLTRSYLAWVWGELRTETQWEDWLLKDEAANRTAVVPLGSAGSKPARLSARPLRFVSLPRGPMTLVEFILDTGRSHQIRAQAAHHGHGLVGDAKYGASPAGARSPFARIALHSHRLAFDHPMSRERMEFEDALPGDLEIG